MEKRLGVAIRYTVLEVALSRAPLLMNSQGIIPDRCGTQFFSVP